MPRRHQALGILLASVIGGACLCGREIDGFGDGGLDAGHDAGTILDAGDGGQDAGDDAGPDAGIFEDAGPLIGTLWVGGWFGFDAASLTTSGAVSPDHVCPYPDGGGEAGFGAEVVDGKGDLWVEPPNGQLYMWTAQQLDQSCASTPAIALQIMSQPPVPFDFLNAMAFDAEGNLWGTTRSSLLAAASPCGATDCAMLVGYRAADLLASGAISPAWILAWGDECTDQPTTPCVVSGLAFDSRGYLWVASHVSLLAYSPATLMAATTQRLDAGGLLPDLYITPPCVAYLYDGGESCFRDYGYNYYDVAFDQRGDLWATVVESNDLVPIGPPMAVEFTRTQLENLRPGLETDPARVISGGAGALAFDNRGDLWVGGGAGDADLLGISLHGGSNLSISCPGAPGGSLAFSPIPPRLPLQP